MSYKKLLEPLEVSRLRWMCTDSVSDLRREILGAINRNTLSKDQAFDYNSEYGLMGGPRRVRVRVILEPLLSSKRKKPKAKGD